MTLDTLTQQELERLWQIQAEIESSLPVSTDTTLLRILASLDRNVLNQLITEHAYRPGEIICREGENGDSLFLIRAGRVAVLKGSFESPTILALRGPGEIIGEMAMLENQPRSATNVAVESTRLLRISRDNFQALVNSNPQIGMSIMKTLSSRLRDADNIRTFALQGGKQLVQEVAELKSEKEHLLELQRVRQETSDLIVHDLRNPLGIIYGILNMFEMVLPEDVLHDNRELLDLASSGCERMQRLVDSLLDVAKLETGEMRLNLASTNLRPIMEEAAHRQALSAQLREVTLRTVFPDDLPLVVIDTEQIDRVLTNLTDNALKYTPEQGQITLQIEVGQEMVAVSVTDTGTGIPDEERERIFERFAQVSGGRPTRRGFGLGLTFCKLTVEAHGGQIWVEAGPHGIGSRFVFTLPIAASYSSR
jgi:signal transduction histidine kinase